jgi:AcrR family transcriptional regulator
MRTAADDVERQSRRRGRRHTSVRDDNQRSPLTDIEADFDRFVVAMMPMARAGKRRGPQPSISAETIYEYALALLDAEGPRAVTVRRLAADLKISTRTLYKRISNRDNLIRNVVKLHFSKFNPDFREGGSWESTAWNWCVGLHTELCAHPHLTDLMTDQDVLVLGDYVDALVNTTVAQGISRSIAAGCCRVNVTIIDALRQVHATRNSESSPSAGTSPLTSAREVHDTVRWILAAVRAESRLTRCPAGDKTLSV